MPLHHCDEGGSRYAELRRSSASSADNPIRYARDRDDGRQCGVNHKLRHSIGDPDSCK
jgi:hypothetical protein